MMTQHPQQLDIFVRNLISKHIHLERKALGTKQYSWYKCVTSLENPAAVSNTESKNFTPPKEAFKYYKSSSQHIKFKKKVPLAVWALILIIGFIGWKIYTVYGISQKAINPEQFETTSQVSASEPINKEADLNTAVQSQKINQDLKADDFIPTLAEKPESKPIYNNVRQVKTYERIAACIEGGKTGCTCYSDQATPLEEVTKEMCKQYARNGLPFNPYKEQDNSANNAQKAPTTS
ncbi:zonula occludens toxin family protein [Neisseria lactamica ATCC 23970]|uniref:Zonula occludens toxin family protein n=2 Tax=Neisseria lactamica TaxID=486 RepID=D0WDM1_NEILA|nr:zonula occludens toxin family protein [Neisseria lactamica ATCC 23970]